MRRLRDLKGVTFLEMTVALFILAIALLGLAGLQLVALQGNTFGQQATLATNLAKNKLSELQDADKLTNGGDTYTDKNNGVTYARQWTVQSDVPQEDMLTVQVQVSWQGPMADRCVTVSTIMRRT